MIVGVRGFDGEFSSHPIHNYNKSSTSNVKVVSVTKLEIRPIYTHKFNIVTWAIVMEISE